MNPLGRTKEVYDRRLALLNSLDPRRYLALGSLGAEDGYDDMRFLVKDGLAEAKENKGSGYVYTYLPTYRGLALRKQLRKG